MVRLRKRSQQAIGTYIVVMWGQPQVLEVWVNGKIILVKTNGSTLQGLILFTINCSYSGPGHLGWRHQADKEYNNSKLRLQKIHQTSTDIS